MKSSESLGLDTALISLLENTNGITETFESIPGLINENREIVLKDLDRQRSEILTMMMAERKAVINEIRKERIEVIMKLMSEREIVLDELIRYSDYVLTEMDSLSRGIVDYSFNRIDHAIDRIFWKTLILLFICFIGLLIIFITHKKI